MKKFGKYPAKTLFQRQWQAVPHRVGTCTPTFIKPTNECTPLCGSQHFSSMSSFISPWPRREETVAVVVEPSSSANSRIFKKKQRLNRYEIKNALSQIWLHSHKGKNQKARPSKALRLLEQLLMEEELTGHVILKQGIVFNVLKACQQQKQKPDRVGDTANEETTAMVVRLENVLDLLRANERLWDESKWPSMIVSVLAKHNVLKAESILQDMYYYHSEHAPNIIDYGAVLQGFAKQGMARQAEELLQTMEDRYASGELKDGPNTISYTSVVHAWAKSHEANAAERAAQVVQRMENLFYRGNARVQPNIVTYSSLLKCYAKEGKPLQAHELLERISDLHQSGTLRDGPNIISYTNVMEAWQKSNAKDAPQTARALLDRMHKMHSEGVPNMQPSSITYGILLKCYAKHGMAAESIKVLKEMLDLYSNGIIQEGPNTVLYNCAINAVVQSNQKDAPQRAEALLNLMHEVKEQQGGGYTHCQPDMHTFGSLLNCYAKWNMADEAENLLQQMHDRHEAGALKYGPNTVLYNIVMNIYAKSGSHGNNKTVASERAERLLQEMISLNNNDGKHNVAPDVITYTSLLNCYGREGKAEKAENLLEKMNSLYNAGELNDRLNLVSYTCLMDALSRSDENGVSRRAQALMDHMWQLHQDGHLDRPPDVAAYTILLKCYDEDGNAEKVKELLVQMHNLHDSGMLERGPDTFSYNIALNILSRTNQEDAVTLAEALVHRMQEMYSSGRSELQPDVITYTTMLKFYAKKGMANEAEQLLQKMQYLHKNGQLKDGPNNFSYNCVMNALAKSQDKNMTERALALLEQMYKDPNAQPDEITKSSFLHCYAQVGDRAVGENIFDTMKSK